MMNKRSMIKASALVLLVLTIFFLILSISRIQAFSKGNNLVNITFNLIRENNSYEGRYYTPNCWFKNDTVQNNSRIEYLSTCLEDAAISICTNSTEYNITNDSYSYPSICNSAIIQQNITCWKKLDSSTFNKKEDYYFDVISGACHLPINVSYDGSLAPASITLNLSRLKAQFMRVGDNVVDVIPLFNIQGIDFNMTEMAWWDSSWANAKNITITNPEASAHLSEYMEVNVTGINASTSNYTKELALIDNSSNQISMQVLYNGTDWAYISFLANLSASETLNYVIYYNNPNANEQNEIITYSANSTANHTKGSQTWDFEPETLNAPPANWFGSVFTNNDGNVTSTSAYAGSKGLENINVDAIGEHAGRNFTTSDSEVAPITWCMWYKHESVTDTNDENYVGVQNKQSSIAGSAAWYFEAASPDLNLKYWDSTNTIVDSGVDYPVNTWAYFCSEELNQSRRSAWINGLAKANNTNHYYDSSVSNFKEFGINIQRVSGMWDDIKIFKGRYYGNLNSTYTIGAEQISNTAPVVQAKTLTPASPSTTDNLICTANITDADGSAKLSGNLTSFRNNIANYSFNQSVTSGVNISVTLGEGNTTKDEVYICQVDAYDGTTHTLSNTSSVTIQNNASEIRDIAISPTTAYTNSSLNCSSRAYDINLDGMTVNITLNNGSTYYNSSTFSISNGSMASLVLANSIQGKGETWNCSVFANDGTVNSALNSTTRTISNLNPMITKTEILPTTAYKTSNLTTNITAQDDDLDLLTCFFLPFKDNIAQTSLQKSFTGITNASNQIYNLTNTSYNKDEVWLFQEWCNDTSNANSSLVNSSSLTISNTAPTTPEIGGVENNTRVIGNSQTLRCANSTDVDSDTINYVFYGGTAANPTSVLQNSTATTYAYSTTDGSTYFWRCKAEDGATGVSAFTAQKTFTENTKPPIVIMTSPINNSRTIGNSVNIQWNSSTDAEGDTVTYELLADTSNPPTTSRQNTTGTSYTLATSDGQVIFTRIKVQDGYETAFGLISTFTENTAPTLPDAGGFTNNSRRTGNSVTLRCENSTDAQSDTITYAMYFDTNANPTTLIQNTTGTTSVQATTDGSAYYYKCKSQDSYETSAFTGIINFTENTAPPVPTLSLPTNNSRVNATTLLTINSVTDAEGDTVYYSIVGATTVNPTALLQNTTGTTYNWTLTRGNSYYWRTKAEDNYEASAYSSQFNFTSNSLPIVTAIAIPDTAYTNSTLNCSANFSDSETDKLNASFTLKNGSTLYSSITIKNIASTSTNSSYLLTAEIQARGENWSCEVNPFDGYENGTTLVDSVVISNTVPTNTSEAVMNVTSASKLTRQINASMNHTDDDGDAKIESFRWFINNIATSNTTSFITNRSFSKNDVVMVQVWVSDDTPSNSTLSNTTSINVSNTAPLSITLYNNDTNTSDTTPTFNWSKSSDVDSDAISYVFELYNSTTFNSTFNIIYNITSQNITLINTLSDGRYYWRVLATDNSSNSSWSDNFTISVDTTNPDITISSPTENQIIIGLISYTVTVTYNFSDNITDASYCYFNVTKEGSTERGTLVSDTQIMNCKSNTSYKFTVTQERLTDNFYRIYQWGNNTAGLTTSINRKFYFDELSGGGGGASGGGGGSSPSSTASSVGLSEIDPYLCTQTYDYIFTKGKTLAYLSTGLIDVIEAETGKTESFVKLETYINNWQGLCSNLINKTLEPKFVCEKIYYFIAGNNYNYSTIDMINLRDEIKNLKDISVSTNLLDSYIDNHNSLCYQKEYSGRLPNKQSQVNLADSTIGGAELLNVTRCDVNTGIKIFDIGIPFIKFSIGRNIPCWGIESWRVLFKIRVDESGNYQVTGIKIWEIIAVILIIVLVRFLALIKAKEGSYKKP